jgi:DNA repair exonuclease SbcCD nuclease subunit
MTTILFIGDPHFQTSNIPEVDLFLEKIEKLAKEKMPDLIVIAGDILHNHERLHTVALNKAYNLVNSMKSIAKTYILVGNHDYISNQQFLTDNHWMNGMKSWENTVIIDKVAEETINGEKFVFVPYVPPGRFIEALDTLDDTWDDASCIFAHQEFSGCKMGAIVSVEGDKWSLENPHVVSGHIHSRQMPQSNIYYSGSAMQHAFGESEKNIIAFFKFTNKKHDLVEIDLGLPRKKIVYMDVEDIETYKPPTTDDKIKVTLTGNYEQFKALKKTAKYKKMLEDGLKVVFKPKKLSKTVENGKEEDSDSLNNEKGEDPIVTGTDFMGILNDIVAEQKDPYLSQAYELIVNGKETRAGDIMFL